MKLLSNLLNWTDFVLQLFNGTTVCKTVSDFYQSFFNCAFIFLLDELQSSRSEVKSKEELKKKSVITNHLSISYKQH